MAHWGEPAVMAKRREEARRLLHQHGVTYNVYSDPQGESRPWPLDLIPLIIPAAEFRLIAEGLRQRARLANAMLSDFYTSRRLLAKGLVPPDMLFRNPGFLRPLVGAWPANGTFVHIYAADVARGPDGKWIILGERLQNPSGLGYAMENRLVTGRVLSGPFQECQIERLGPYYDLLREDLLTHLPTRREAERQPRVVLLTPGPLTETYFEHAFLARRLGITLVEGADLTVRDRRVFLKTLEGLEPVDIILRRQDDDFCDPLELMPDSSLGVAGLVEAVRAGTVTIANALGAGAAEAAALHSRTEAMCDALLGESLILQNARTLWMGDPDAWEILNDNPDSWIVKPAFPQQKSAPVLLGDLDAVERAELLAKIKAEPYKYAAQERVHLSTAPCSIDGSFEPRPFSVRFYLTAIGDGEYRALPGGLVRFADGEGGTVVSMQVGGGSKDCWVLSDGPARRRIPMSRTPALPVSTALPSRVAEGLYWLGRYVERADGAVRLLRGAYTRLTDDAWPGSDRQLSVILRVMAYLAMISPDIAQQSEDGPHRALRHALDAAVYKPGNTYSLSSLLRNVRRTGGGVRDRIAAEMWRVLAQQDQLSFESDRDDDARVLMQLEDVATDLAAVVGLQQESMIRGTGWRFLDLGRRLERALYLMALFGASGMLDSDDYDTLQAVLEMADSAITYRTRYVGLPTRGRVLDLLMVAGRHPRSVAFQLAGIEEHLAALSQEPAGAVARPDRLLLASLQRSIHASPLDSAKLTELLSLVSRIENGLPELSDHIDSAFFAHAGYATRRRRHRA
jgi:uncharacterized circularly permuted ATP-grasp superfamily protein/uncharacterized alpha-E superfamily protein